MIDYQPPDISTGGFFDSVTLRTIIGMYRIVCKKRGEPDFGFLLVYI